MEHIILGFDGTSASVSALDWVAARAARRASRVGIVNVISDPSHDHDSELGRLTDAESSLRERAPETTIELHVLEGGPTEALAAFAAQADLLVVGINTGHPIRASLAGAFPLRLSARSHVPVVLVPAGWVDRDEAVSVGIADDDSSDAALSFAVREAGSHDVPLRLVHAWLMPAPTYVGAAALVSTPEAALASHRDTINTATRWVTERFTTIRVQSELVRDSSIAALLRLASTSSLIVIGTHHRGLLAGSLLGSVAQDVIWQSDCPIAIVPNEHGSDRSTPQDAA